MSRERRAPRGTGGGGERVSVATFLEWDEAQRAAHLESIGDAEAELIRFGDEAERLASSDPARAAAWLQELRHACGKPQVFPRAIARAARGEVLALAYLGRLDEAIGLAEAARVAALASGARIEAARLRLAAMQPLLKRGRIDEAIREGESAAAELAAEGEPALAARAQINLGNVHKAAGRSAEALSNLDAALAALRGDAALEAAIENTRGEALLQLDRFREARAAFDRAIAHFRDAAQPFAWAVAEGNLADLAARAGDLAEAFERFAAARERLPEQAAGHAARLLLEEGEVFAATGLLEVALDRLIEASARLSALGLAFESHRAALAVARTRVALGLDEAALVALRESVPPDGDARAMLRMQALEAVAQSGSAAGALDESAQAEARASAERLAEAITSFEPSLDRVLATAHLATARERLGDLAAALDAARSAADEAESLGLTTVVAGAASTRARLARRRGFREEALAAARRAVEATERTRSSFGADRLRSAFLGSRLAGYEELVLSLVARGGQSIEEAFEVAELARSRTLIERLFGSLPEAGDERDAEVARLRERLRGLHARLATIARDDARSVAIDPIRIELAETEDALERRLSETAGASGRATQDLGTPRPRSAWRECLAEDQAIVEYFEAAGRLLAFVARRGGVSVVELPVSAGEVEDAISKLHFRIRRRLRSPSGSLPSPAVEVEGLLDRLAGWLWSPILGALEGTSRVILAPHGRMHAVPFTAIAKRDGDSDRVLSIVPAAAAWARLASTAPAGDAPGEMLVVGVADAAAPRIAEEIAAVARAVEGTRRVRVLEGADATAERVLAALADPQVEIAHLACHGQFLPEAPQASGLRVHDRWISVRELLALPRTPATVVLSGCDTGSVAVMPGEEIFGLPRAFLAGGTRRLVGSLWSVGDLDTCELMVDFHRRWSTVDPDGARPSLAAALAASQRERRSAAPHPAHWASFIAIGDAS